MRRAGLRDDVLEELAAPYLRRAAAAESRGERIRACAFRVIGSAFQLLPKWREYRVARGEYFGPLSTGAFGEAPDMAVFDHPEAVELLTRRALRTRNLRRRARLADAAWEYGGSADTARMAIDAYETIGAAGVSSDTEFAPMYGAAEIARAAVLARSISDESRLARLAETIRRALNELVDRDEHVALFVLVEAILATQLDDLLEHADATLERHYMRLAGADADNFSFQRSVLKLRRHIAARRREPSASLQRLDRELAEAVAREAAWKGQHYKSGALVEMHFLEEAAQRFEALGDHDRAAELRTRQRGAFPRAQFRRFEHTVTIDAGPFREWLGRVLGSTEQKAQLWPEILRALPVPTREEIEQMQADERRELPFLAHASVTTVTPDGVTQTVPAEEAARRRAEDFAYDKFHGPRVALLVKLAMEDYGVGVSDALPVLTATGRVDETSRALLERLGRAYDAHDWLTVAYLAGPLLERVVRRLAATLGLETMRTNRTAPQRSTARREYVSIEDLLARLPLDSNVRDYLRWVVSWPGLNLRNAVGHGLLEMDRCHEVLGAHVLFSLIALAFADLAAVSAE